MNGTSCDVCKVIVLDHRGCCNDDEDEATLPWASATSVCVASRVYSDGAKQVIPPSLYSTHSHFLILCIRTFLPPFFADQTKKKFPIQVPEEMRICCREEKTMPYILFLLADHVTRAIPSGRLLPSRVCVYSRPR